MKALISLLLMALVGCATPESGSKTQMMRDFDEASHADGDAYTADSFNFRKPMPDRSDWKPTQFFYKECSTGGAAFFSKTAYECTSP